jgi:hypothetical protein
MATLGQAESAKVEISPGGDHAGLHARGCPRSHPQRCTASHTHGNRQDGQRYRAYRAMDSPYNNLLQTGKQPMAPIAVALGREIPGCDITVRAVSLVIQRGPERLWNWQPVGTASLGGS